MPLKAEQPTHGRGHVPALDGVRGLAIIAVMLFHQTVMIPAGRADEAFRSAFSVGWMGVDLFFVLSGFLITGILLESKAGCHYFRNFYARRTLRIFPLYYLIVAVSLLILPYVAHAKAENFGRITGDETFYWLYLSNWSTGFRGAWRHGILDICWSLAIEEQFYLVWPAVVLLFPRKHLTGICGGLIATALVLRWAGLASGLVGPVGAYCYTPCRMDGLALGALLALANHGPFGLIRLVRPSRFVGLGAALGLLAIFGFVGGTDSQNSGMTMQTLGYTCVVLVCGALLVAALTVPASSLLGRWFAHPVLRFFGRYSYAMYLFHNPIRAVVRDRVYGPAQFLTIAGSSIPGQIVFYILAGGATVAAALVSWNLYEKHFLKLKVLFPSNAQVVDETAQEPELAAATAG